MSQSNYINRPTTSDDYLNPTEEKVPSGYLTMEKRQVPEMDNGCYEEIDSGEYPSPTTSSLPHRYLEITDVIQPEGYRGNQYDDTTHHGISLTTGHEFKMPGKNQTAIIRRWKIIYVITFILFMAMTVSLVGLLIYFHLSTNSILTDDPQQLCPKVPCFDNKYCSSIHLKDRIYLGCPCTQEFVDSNCSLRKFGPYGASERYLTFSHKDMFEKYGVLDHIDAWDYQHNHLLGLQFGYNDHSTDALGVGGNSSNSSQDPKTFTLGNDEHITKVCTWSGKYPLEINYYVIRKIEFWSSKGRVMTAGGVNVGEEVDKQCTPDDIGFLAYVEGKAASAVDSLDFIFSLS